MAERITRNYSRANLVSFHLTEWPLVSMSLFIIGLSERQLGLTYMAALLATWWHFLSAQICATLVPRTLGPWHLGIRWSPAEQLHSMHLLCCGFLDPPGGWLASFPVSASNTRSTLSSDSLHFLSTMAMSSTTYVSFSHSDFSVCVEGGRCL